MTSIDVSAVGHPSAARVHPLQWGRQHPVAVLGALILATAVVVAILAPELAPYGQYQQVGPPFGRPSGAHPLGLDDVGHDVLSLLMWGARISLLVGFVAGTAAVALGGLIGLTAGYFGGGIDSFLAALTDYFLVIPALPLAIVAATLFGPNLRNEIIIITLLSWPITMRVIRAQAKSTRERTYIHRVQALGGSHFRVLLRHVLPAVSPLLVASTVLAVGNAIFFEAALSFLGLGDPTKISWGKMIADAFNRGAVSVGAWWAIVPPGIAIGIVVLAATLVGRSLEDAMNPRLAVSHLGVGLLRIRERHQAAHQDAD